MDKTPPAHLVRFYEADDVLAAAVARFLGEGLSGGDALIVIATPEHRQAFQRRLEADGFDVEAALASGQLTCLDADETLSTFMRAGEPDADLFDAAIGGLVAERVASGNGARLRAFGEMVDLLWKRGDRQAAVRLEELWNGIQRRQSFTLLCAYALGGFYKEPAAIHTVCAVHTHVLDSVAPGDGALTASSLPPHHAATLAREIAHRAEVEAALRASLRELRRKEEDLRRSEAEFRDFVENAPLGVHRVGPDGIILWVNRAELDLLGYAEDEYVGHPVREFHADQDAIDDIWTRLMRREALHNCEARLRAKDGSIKHVLISSNVYAPAGKFVHTRCFTRDVTERKKARESLERFRAAAAGRAQRLSKITAAIADAVTEADVFEALVDRVADATDASSAALWVVDEGSATSRLVRASGYSEVALRAMEVVPLDVTPGIPAVDSIRTGEPIFISSQTALLEQYPHLTGLATPGRSYRVSCLPLRAHGRVVGALALTIEEGRESVEEREFLLLVARYASQAIERLRLYQETVAARTRAEQLYRFAQAVVAADRVELVFEAATDAIERALGVKRSAILTFDGEGVMRFRAWRNLSDGYRAAVEGHSPWARDAAAPTPVLVSDAATDPAMTPYRSLFQSEGVGALAFIPLVTRGRLLGKFMVYYEQTHTFAPHELETACAIANHLASVISRFAAVAKLEDTIRYNEIFAGVLAHDLRNPLGAIMTAAQLALMRREGEGVAAKDVKPLSRILSSGQRMKTMIDQLLDLTLSRSGGGIEVEVRPADLGEICAQATGELELAHPDWNIQRQSVGDQSGTWDAERLVQVLSNLVCNAGQHGTREAAITIKLDGTATDRVTCAVHNMGAVPESLLPHLFDPFRSTRHRRDQSSGLGLGLFIVREIVRAHGGTVDVSSSEAEGTTFSISLPRDLRGIARGTEHGGGSGRAADPVL